MNNEQAKIEALARQLDQVFPSGQQKIHLEKGNALLSAGVDFAQAPFPELSAAALTRVEARMLKVYTALAPRPVIRFVVPRRAAAVASFVAVMMVGSLVPVAAASLPGEPLYPVKQGIEQVELAFASSPESRASVYLNHAERRLNEANTLLGRGTYNADLFSAVLINADKALNIQMSESVMAKVEMLTVNVEQSLAVAHQLETPLPVGSLENTIETLRSTVILPNCCLATATPTMTAISTATQMATDTATSTATQPPTSTKMPTKMPPAIPTRRPTTQPTLVPTSQPNSSDNPRQGNSGNPNLGEGNPDNQGNPPADPPVDDNGNQGHSPGSGGGGNSNGNAGGGNSGVSGGKAK